jgi:anti-sigma regulatory factor (Ser/Thr protein kinase)
MRQQGMSGWRGVPAGSCRAWPLPADQTCAGIARRLFREAVAQLGLEPGVLDDATLMTSELAANTLHASAAAHAHAHGDSYAEAEPCQPELWLYLRGVGLARELVCKVFDCYRGWLHGQPPSRSGQAHFGSAGLPDIGGRGLQIVHELSGGRWGHHPTRARLGGRGPAGERAGKVVWFAVSAPLAHARLADVTGLRAYTRSVDVSAARRHERISARQAARELTQMLGERGLRTRTVPVSADLADGDVSVLAVGDELTLWLGGGSVSLTGPEDSRDRWRYTDLVEAAEQTVRRYEEIGARSGRPAAYRSTASARLA